MSQVFSNQKESREALDEDAFLFFIRQLLNELQFVLDLPYAKFWATITKS